MTLTPKMRPFGLALLVAAMPGVAEAEPTPPVTELPPEGGHSPAERFASVITVSQVGCPDLNVERIRQQLRLELSTLIPVVTELPQLAVEFACTDERVRVTLADSVTVKVVARDVSLGASADNERTLALAASELFLASWAELLIERPNTPKRQLDTVATAAPRTAPTTCTPAFSQ